MRSSQTLEDDLREIPGEVIEGDPTPGLVLVFSGDRPAFGVVPLAGRAIEIGRGKVGDLEIDDRRMSRAHARIAFDGGAWSACDLGSRNGSSADGQDLAAGTARPARKVVRAGASLFLLAADTRPFRAGIARSGEAVMGPALQRAFAAVTRAARFGRVLHITGESGSGKELSARAFHTASPANAGPFVAVNAATLKPELAEALLFGARKGFYTGAPGGPGLVQSADGGTLFLDEVAELDAAVQAKLLRALEAGEVVPLGATRPERVSFRFCSATHADLRGLVAAGKMREDLYYRIATPTVVLPPLRERPEEIPWLVEHAVRSVPATAALAVHVSFVEACLLRPWPGNVRELTAEVRAAAQWAAEDGGVLLARHLGERAGTAAPAPLRAPEPGSAEPGSEPARSAAPRPSDEAIEAALRATGNNVARAARELGMHRTQLNRWLDRRKKQAEGGGKGD